MLPVLYLVLDANENPISSWQWQQVSLIRCGTKRDAACVSEAPCQRQVKCSSVRFCSFEGEGNWACPAQASLESGTAQGVTEARIPPESDTAQRVTEARVPPRVNHGSGSNGSLGPPRIRHGSGGNRGHSTVLPSVGSREIGAVGGRRRTSCSQGGPTPSQSIKPQGKVETFSPIHG